MYQTHYMAVGLAQLLAVGAVSAWTPGTYPAPSRDLAVDRQSRNDVLSFWHGVYQASEGFEGRMNWTGNYGTAAGAEGTNSPEFIADMERRLNYFRAMSGVPANAVMNSDSTVRIEASDAHTPPTNTLKSAAAQRAALMLVMNHSSTGVNPAFTHNPPVNSTWTAVPWNANNKGNLGFNIFGPNALTSYMREEALTGVGGENESVGHRRWLMKSTYTNFATGDIPGFYSTTSLRPAANVTYVLQKAGETVAVPPAFISYPSPGFFPAPLNSRFWSLTYPGANFSSATVSVTQIGGAAVPVTIRSRSFSAGDPTIVWEVPPEHATALLSQDRTYEVTVTGITGTGVPNSHSYQFTLINPDTITSDQSLSGTAVPHSGTPANYTFTTPESAEALRVNTYRQTAVLWTETAEVGAASSVIDLTEDAYPLISTVSYGGFAPIAGARSFRLTHPSLQNPADQLFQLGRQIIPNANATLTFKFKRGYMTPNSKLDLESSSDGGATWSKFGTTISGLGNSLSNATLNGSAAIPQSPTPLLLRFRFYYGGSGGIFVHEIYPTIPTGIFIDTITLTNADWLEPRKSNDLATSASSFTLDTSTQGGPMVVGEQWHLALQTKLGNEWFPEGPLKSIVPSATPPPTPYQIWETENPEITGGFAGDHDLDGIPNGIEYAFFDNPLVNSSESSQIILLPGGTEISMQRSLPVTRIGVSYSAECSETLNGDWSSQNVTVTISGGIITATAPRPLSGTCFLRWKVTLQ